VLGPPDIFDVVISPDGQLVAAIGMEGGALWNLADGTRTALDLGTAEWARKLAFSRDSQQLAVVAPTVGTVFDRRGARIHRLRLPAGYLEQVAFSPEGSRLLVTDHDNQATLHDLATGQRRSMRGHVSAVRGWFLADGRTLISIGGTDRPTIIRWRDDLPLDPAGLRAWIDAATTARIGEDGRLLGGT
jgi:WD40 repeat protein